MITLLLIIAAVVVIMAVILARWRARPALHNLTGLIEQAESTAAHTKEWLRNSLIKEHLAIETGELGSMAETYAHLKERYMDDQEKLWKLAMDWWAYNDILAEIIHARENVNVDSRPDAHERYAREMRGLNFKRKNIEKRYKKMMAKEPKYMTTPNA